MNRRRPLFVLSSTLATLIRRHDKLTYKISSELVLSIAICPISTKVRVWILRLFFPGQAFCLSFPFIRFGVFWSPSPFKQLRPTLFASPNTLRIEGRFLKAALWLSHTDHLHCLPPLYS